MSARPAQQSGGAGGDGVVAVLIVALVWWVGGSHPASPTSPQQARPRSSAHTDPGPSTRPPAGLTFTDAAGCRPAGDYASPELDRRVRELLVAIATHHPIRVSCLRTGHSRYVRGTDRVSNHTVWRAVDIDQVDRHPVSPSNAAARSLALWIGRGHAGVQPSEVGSPWPFGRRPWFTDPGHQNHLHVGFPGPTQAGGAR